MMKHIVHSLLVAGFTIGTTGIAGGRPLPASAPGTSSSPMVTGVFYAVMNMASKQCLDDADGSASNGAVLQQWSCVDGNTNQEWMFTETSDGFYKAATYNSTTLTWNVADSGKTAGSNMQLWTYGGGLNEQFFPVKMADGSFKFVVRNSGLCLSVPGGTHRDGQRLQVDTCDGSAHEAFTLTRV